MLGLIGDIMNTSTCSIQVPINKLQKTGCLQRSSINNLPDWAISHILSRLPTKDPVRTSVLSKDWEYKWTSMYNTELDDSHTYRKNSKTTFANFVERILLFLQNLQSFRLSCSKKYNLDRIKTWISVASSRDLHFLQIFCREIEGIVLPRNLHNCQSLRKLDLNMPCTFKVPAKICFLHLTTLSLMKLEISNELSSFDLVKFEFPVLETFALLHCKWLNVKSVEIYAPKMTSFEYATGYGYDHGMVDYSIKITGSRFVRFIFNGNLPENIVFSGSTVVYADLTSIYGSNDLHLFEKSVLRIRELLNGFPRLKELQVSGGLVAEAISQSELGLPLPRYYDMKRLVISLGTVEALLQLFHAAPSLKFLVIYMSGWSDYDYDDEYVPSCIALEEVSLKGFCGKINELKLAKCFLKNALQLKRISLFVVSDPRISKDEITEELSAYPAASTCVTISVN